MWLRALRALRNPLGLPPHPHGGVSFPMAQYSFSFYFSPDRDPPFRKPPPWPGARVRGRKRRKKKKKERKEEKSLRGFFSVPTIWRPFKQNALLVSLIEPLSWSVPRRGAACAASAALARKKEPKSGGLRGTQGQVNFRRNFCRVFSLRVQIKPPKVETLRKKQYLVKTLRTSGPRKRYQFPPLPSF